MTTFKLHKLLGIGVLGAVLAAGCNHSRRCSPCAVMPSCGSVAVLPGPSSEVSTVMHKEPVPQNAESGNIAVTAVAPGTSSGPVMGTVEFTPAQAESMGIKPGYTPSALIVPASSSMPLVQQPAEPKKLNAAE